MITVYWEGKETQIERDSARVSEVLEYMGILPEVVIVARNGEVVSEDEVLRSGDRVKIIKAISGG